MTGANPKLNNRKKGSVYEEKAAAFLIAKKYLILERNFRRKTGEIDLIVKDTEEDAIVFTEVKYRLRKATGYPEDAVTKEKQLRIRRTAEWYIKEKGIPWNTKMRFDVISILNDEIKHIRNAFGGF